MGENDGLGLISVSHILTLVVTNGGGNLTGKGNRKIVYGDDIYIDKIGVSNGI